MEHSGRRARARRFGGDGTVDRDHGLEPGGTYLVTGCAGFIGNHLVDAIYATDAPWSESTPSSTTIRAPSRRATSSSAVGAVICASPTLTSPRRRSTCSWWDVDGVFHLAARPGVRTSWGSDFASYARDNLLVTQRVFEAAVQRNLRVVYASSSSVYGNAESYPVREDGPLARLPLRRDQAGR